MKNNFNPRARMKTEHFITNESARIAARCKQRSRHSEDNDWTNGFTKPN